MEQMMGWMLARIDSFQEVMAKLDAHYERMEALVDVSVKKMKACLQKMEATDLEANPGEIESESLHEEVPKEDTTVRTVKSIEEVVWGSASSCRAPLITEETDPG
jgi:hypothetical protein